MDIISDGSADLDDPLIRKDLEEPLVHRQALDPEQIGPVRPGELQKSDPVVMVLGGEIGPGLRVESQDLLPSEILQGTEESESLPVNHDNLTGERPRVHLLNFLWRDTDLVHTACRLRERGPADGRSCPRAGC